MLLLIIASDKLVFGASSIALKAGVSPLFIGIIIIGLGTSSPELFVNVISAIKGDTGLAMGNILGSNISNMGLVIGTAGLIAGKIKVDSKLIKAEIPVMVSASLLLLLLILDFPPFTNDSSNSLVLSFKDGLILLLGLCLYLLYTFNTMKPSGNSMINPPEPETLKTDEKKTGSAVLNILLGIGGLYLGGEFIISSSLDIASTLGAGTLTLGIIVGVGTSLPELATGINCALKKQTDLVIGNVVGSNIFNVLLILGTTAVIRSVSLSMDILIHFGFMIAVTILFYISLGSKRVLNRIEAAMLLMAGIGYLAFSMITG